MPSAPQPTWQTPPRTLPTAVVEGKRGDGCGSLAAQASTWQEHTPLVLPFHWPKEVTRPCPASQTVLTLHTILPHPEVRVGRVWWMALRTETRTSGISLNLSVLQREWEPVHLPLNFRKEWQVSIHVTGHFDGQGVREHALGHEL